MSSILLLNNQIEVHNRLSQLLTITQQIGLQGSGKLIQNSIQLKLDNRDGMFSLCEDKSYIKNSLWINSPAKVYDNNSNLIYDGIIYNVLSDENSTTFFVADNLSKYMKQKVNYTSSTAETPAEAIQNIMDSLSFTYYDSESIGKSHNIYDTNSCKIMVTFETDDNITLQAALEKIAEYGAANIYNRNGKIYFSHPPDTAEETNVLISEDDIKIFPQIAVLRDNVLNDYRLYYDGCSGTPITDSGQNDIGSKSRSIFGTNSLPEFTSDEGAQIYYTTSAAAEYIGEKWIKLTHIDYSELSCRPKYAMSIRVNFDFIQYVEINKNIKLNYKDWSEKVFKVYTQSINYDKEFIDLYIVEEQCS